MIPEDRFTNTVADAAAYERYRSSSSYDSGYDRYDAAADAANDAWSEMVDKHLHPMVDEVMEQVEELWGEIEETGQDQPHPWTWERYLLSIWQDEKEGGEDALREELEEHFRDEAEDAARDEAYDNQPCCRSRDCPCGGY